jgi:hypothetical protein
MGKLSNAQSLIGAGRLVLLVVAIVISGFQVARIASAARQQFAIRQGRFNEVSPRNGDHSSISIPVLSPHGRIDSVALRGTLLVFVYNTNCVPCARNVPRWLDLAVTARRIKPDLPILAVSVEDDDRAREYWAGLLGQIRLIRTPNPDHLARSLQVTSTPSTVLVVDGKLASVTVGFLGERKQEAIARRLKASVSRTRG